MLSGCGGPEEVASLGTVAASSVIAVSQLEAAESYYACLLGEGIPVRFAESPGQQAEVTWEGDVWVVWSERYGFDVRGDPEVDPMPGWALSLIEGSVAPADQKAHLFIDGLDYSEGFAKCVADSAYEHPVYWIDPTDELTYETKLAAVTNEWAACAREHGYPSIADADPPKADNGRTQPEVRIPLSMTVPELRELLVSCHFFDRERAQYEVDAEARGEDVEYALLPNLVVDSLGGTARDQELLETAPEEDLQRAVDLHNTLYEELNEFYAPGGTDEDY
jgi:hypothetical protein